MKKKLGIVYGGKSAEHEVSLSTARAVTQAVDFGKYEVIPVYITYDGEWRRGESLKGSRGYTRGASLTEDGNSQAG